MFLKIDINNSKEVRVVKHFVNWSESLHLWKNIDISEESYGFICYKNKEIAFDSGDLVDRFTFYLPDRNFTHTIAGDFENVKEKIETAIRIGLEIEME